ncbi:MAG: hypothetical protein HYX50_01700 [Chloroflexi bacterium]|nr:hypothetical protein [Chloroflexota bacterium]
MRQKIIASGIALTLVSLAVVGAFASQDGVSFLDLTPTPDGSATPADTATATNTPDATETPTPEATATATPDGTSTNTPEATATNTPDVTATPSNTVTPEATATSTGGDGEVHGIPSTNPSHQDGDGDDVCEKGETEVKTTPSGTQVRVPCQAAKGPGRGRSGGGGPDTTGDNSDGEEGD